MKNIVCIKWGNLYGSIYVNNLFSMVKRNITPPFRFVCLTDNTNGIHKKIETRPLTDKTLKGWWTKISLFKDPLYDIKGDVFFIDLDMVIVDNIDCFFSHAPKKLVMKWDYPHHGGMSSCVMRFPVGEYSHIYNNLDLKKIDHAVDNRKSNFKKHKFWGDQMWISHQMENREVAFWPKQWNAKFGLDCHIDPKFKKTIGEIPRKQRSGKRVFGVPKQAKIISFAGTSQRHEKEIGKIGKWWHSKDINE